MGSTPENIGAEQNRFSGQVESWKGTGSWLARTGLLFRNTGCAGQTGRPRQHTLLDPPTPVSTPGSVR